MRSMSTPLSDHINKGWEGIPTLPDDIGSIPAPLPDKGKGKEDPRRAVNEESILASKK